MPPVIAVLATIAVFVALAAPFIEQHIRLRKDR